MAWRPSRSGEDASSTGRSPLAGAATLVLAAWVLTALVLAAGLAGCLGSGPVGEDVILPGESPPTATAAPPASAGPEFTPEQAAAASEVLVVFEEFRELQVELYAEPDDSFAPRQRLADFLTEPLLPIAANSVTVHYHLGVARAGRPTWEPVVTEVRLDADPPAATIQDCLDAAGWTFVSLETGDEVDYGSLAVPIEPGPGRQAWEFTALRNGPAGSWRLATGGTTPDEEC